MDLLTNFCSSQKILRGILLFVVFLSLTTCKTHKVLALKDVKTAKILYKFDLDADNAFSVSFFHSVNRSNVEECYSFENGRIVLKSCIFSTFGAGMTSDLGEGWHFEMLDNGKMRYSNINFEIKHLVYAVSTVFDHHLHIDGTDWNLTDLGLKGRCVEFCIF